MDTIYSLCTDPSKRCLLRSCDPHFGRRYHNDAGHRAVPWTGQSLSSRDRCRCELQRRTRIPWIGAARPEDGCPEGSKDFRLGVDTQRTENTRVTAALSALLIVASNLVG